MKKWVRIFLQIGISGIFLYFALRHVEFKEATKVLNSLNITLLIIGTLLHFSSFFIRAYRWKVLMQPIKQVNYSSMFQILSVSYAANNVIPLRAGDILRGILIGNKENISKVSSLSTVLVERIADGMMLLIFLFVSLGLTTIDSAWKIKFMLLSAVLFLLAFSGLVVLMVFKEKFISSFGKLIKRFSENLEVKVTDILRDVLVSFRVIESLPLLIKVFITSLVIWGLEGSFYGFGCLALGMPPNESFLIGVVCVAIVNLGIMIPSSPGYVGTFEFFTIFALSLFGISPHVSAGYSILVHVLQYVPITLVGCLIWLTIDMQHIRIRKTMEVSR